MRRSLKTESGGFTLVELLLAGVVMSVLLAMAVPAFQNGWRQRAPAQVLDDVAALAAHAKERAILEGRPFRLSATPEGVILEAAVPDSWEPVSTPARALPAGLAINAIPATITFLPDGTSSAGTVRVEKAGRAIGRLEIDAVSGEARRTEA